MRDDAELHELPPLVRLDPPVVVEVYADREWWPGLATAYRGQRVSVTWTRGPGLRHMTWESADRVRRVGDGEEPPPAGEGEAGAR